MKTTAYEDLSEEELEQVRISHLAWLSIEDLKKKQEQVQEELIIDDIGDVDDKDKD